MTGLTPQDIDAAATTAYADVLTDAQRQMTGAELIRSLTPDQRKDIEAKTLPCQRAAAHFFHNLGAATVLELRTKRRWKINRQRYAALCAEHNITEDDLAENGIMRDAFDHYIAQVRALYAGHSSRKLRFLADSLFGPNGSLEKNLMVRSGGLKFI